MSTTFGELKTRVSTVLQDPSRRAFTEALVEELILDGLVEVGRIAPEQFIEDLTPVDYQLSYQLRSNDFGVVTYSLTAEADTDLITSTAHGLEVGDFILFSALVGGTGIPGSAYVLTVPTADTFTISASSGGSTVDITVDATGGLWAHYGGGQAVPEIEVSRVEVWDPTTLPESFIADVVSASRNNTAGDTGWYVWGGNLYLPTRTVSGLIGYGEQYVIRVTGYSPYVPPQTNDDVLAVSKEVEQAIIWYTRLTAIELLLASRDLFTQWQTRSGNTDISPAQLASQKSMAEAQWQRKSRAITRLRSEY